MGDNPLLPFVLLPLFLVGPHMVALTTHNKMIDPVRLLQQAILQFSPCLHHLRHLVHKGSCISAVKSFCDYMLTIAILVLVAVSFLLSKLQLLKLVLHSEGSSTLKSFNSLKHSLIKVVHLNNHLLLKSN